MNYTQHYTRLVERSKNRLFTDYTETHHILPRCMGGMDCVDNLVELTPEEHYVAHQLLAKMHPHEPKLIFAAHAMANMGVNRVGMREYGWIKKKRAQILSEKMSGAGNHMFGKVGSMTGRTHTPEALQKMSEKSKGKSKSGQHRANIIKALTGHLVSDETKQKLRERQLPEAWAEDRMGTNNVRYGIAHTEDTKAKMKLASQQKERRVCDHCGKELLLSHLARYHGDKCKMKVSN